MNLRLKLFTVQTLGIISLVSIILFVLSYQFAIPNKLCISLILGTLFYALFEYLFLPDINLVIKTKFYYWKDNFVQLFFILIYVLSLVLVMPPISISNSSLYIVWTDLSPLHIAKLIASILLTSFLPGYVIVRILTFKLDHKDFSNVGVGVLSVLLSFALTSSITFLNWVIEHGFMELNNTLFLSYSLILAFFIFLSFIRRNKLGRCETSNATISLNSFYKFLVLSCIVAYLTWAYHSTHFIPQTVPIIGDELNHAGSTLQILRGWQSWQSIEVESIFSSPYFFHLFLVAATSLSDVPLFNVYLSLFFLLFLPAFAFYFMTQMIFRNEKDISLLATVIFSVFSGFGWIYASYLSRNVVGTYETSTIIQASQRTYDILYSTWFPIYIAPYLVDLSIFFVLIGLMGYKYISTKTLCILTVLLVALGTLVHIEKILTFAFLLLILSLLYVLKIARFINHPKLMLSSFIIGLLMFFALNFVAPYKIALEYSSIILKVFLICILGLTLVVISDLFRKKINLSLTVSRTYLKKILGYFILSLYFILSIALFYSFDSYIFKGQSVPLWFLPMKMGVAGILSLFGILYGAQERNRVNFFITLCLCVLLMQLLLYHLPIFTISDIMPEYRQIRDVLWPFVSVVAAFGIKKIVEIFKGYHWFDKSLLKYLTVCLLLFSIFVSGIPSNLLKVQYFASVQRVISAEDMDALNYINTLEISSGSFILTGSLKDELRAATGVSVFSLDDPVYSPLIFDSKSPGTCLWTLNYLNIRYIYMREQDLQILRSKYGDSFFMWLMPHLPLIFKNNAASIYLVPPFSPPLETSDVVVVTGDLLAHSKALTENSIWIDDRFMDGWREGVVNNVENLTFTSDGDIATLKAKTMQGQQAAVFYIKNLKEKITTSNDTVAIIKFKSNTATSYAILDIIYSGGSTERLQLGNKGYMKSSEWITVTHLLQPNKSVEAIRVGMTDNKEGNGEGIWCSFDYVAIAQVGKLADYYPPSLLTAQMQINYATISEFDPSLFNYKTIFIADKNFTSSKVSQYINWVKNGGNLIIISQQGRGVFSNILGIKESDKPFTVNRITNLEGEFIEIPYVSTYKLQFNDTSIRVLANYAIQNTTVSPLALLKNIENGKIIYLDIAPISRDSIGSQYFIKTTKLIGDILQKQVNFELFNSSAYRRTFYIKNKGEISLQGESCITTPSIVFGFDSLSKVTINFSKSNLVENVNNSEPLLENATVDNIELNGVIPTTIHVDGKISISPLDSNNYVKLRIYGKLLIKFNIVSNSEVKVTFQSGKYTNFYEGVLLLQVPYTENIELIMRDPTITNNGIAVFESMFSSYPYEFQSSGNRGEFDGYMELKIISSEKIVSLINTQLRGQMHIDIPAYSIFNDDFKFFINFPLESTFFIISIFSLMIFVYLMLNKGKGTING